MDGGEFDILWKGAVDALIQVISPVKPDEREFPSSVSKQHSNGIFI